MSDRSIEYQVPAGAPVERADKLFAAKFEEVSRARLQRAFDAGQVTFEGEVIQKRFKITRPGLLRAVLEEAQSDAAPCPVDLPLDVVYEDEALIVVNKAAGMITHPGSGTGEDTLVHALLHHCRGRLSGVGAPERPGIVHRLDKETSGLILAAKTDQAHHKLALAFSQRETFKRYSALVLGKPKKNSGSIQEPIGRHPVVRTRMAVRRDGREARTDYEQCRVFGAYASQLSCVIHTGRTHQIRVHLSHLGHPLLGDAAYGFKPQRLPGVEIPRVMLHATELKLAHPLTGQALRFQADPPEDFSSVVQALRAKSR